MQIRLTILFLFVGMITFSQEDTFEIQGYAPGFVGKKVELFTYQDYITMTRYKLGEGFVDPKDSVFHIKLNVGSTIKGIIQIEKTEAEMYLAPGTTYMIYFPLAVDQPISFQNQRTDISFVGLDTNDINYRIIQYHQWFDTYVYYHQKSIAGGQFLAYLDTFSMYAADVYKDVKDEYFITYVRYNIAEMQQALGANNRSELRLRTFLTYLQPFPVYYENDQYMKFFKGFYSRKLDEYQPEVETEINLAIMKSSPTILMAAMKKDLFLVNPEIREMVMIDKLGKLFYERYDQKRNILVILDSVAHHAAYPLSATIAKNVMRYITSLEPGFPAPAINLQNERDSMNSVTWKKYEGKFVYLNFFETWNDNGKVDMRIISELKEKYGDYVSFLSVCVDPKKADFDQYLEENPKFDWDIVYLGQDSKLKTDFRVSQTPAYFLIDQSGFIALAPAPTPRPDGEYESIDKTFFYIKKALDPVNGNRIGDP